jgi:hypothetical protein
MWHGRAWRQGLQDPDRPVTRARIFAVLGLAAAAVGIGVVVFASGAFGGSSPSSSADNTYPTSIATLERRTLTAQTQVDATLGYDNPATIVAPAGTAPSAVLQAQQTVSTGESQLAAARATASADGKALTQAQATLAADRQKLAVDCAGNEAASAGGATTPSPCATDAQAVTADEQAAAQAQAKAQSDTQAVSAAQTSVAGARVSLAQARASATPYGQSSTYSALPAVGQIVRRGEALYEISGQPVLLLYGSAAPWRAFVPGMTPGRDVAELNRSLNLQGDAFTSATAAAIRALQSAHGATPTGELLLGSVVFEPGAVRVTSVTPTLGATVQPGSVLGITSNRRVVTIALDASTQASVKVGDPVTITLPDQSTTPGRVTYVGTVATTPPDQGNGNGPSSPTIEVDVTPTHPAATGRLDQAPVTVSITTDSVKDALVAPVAALLALSSGGYALEVIGAGGVHHLEAVEPGLFDDNEGLVQVTGTGVSAGQRVVVPGGQ